MVKVNGLGRHLVVPRFHQTVLFQRIQEEDPSRCPSEAEFRASWDGAAKGLSGGRSRHKEQKRRWCIAEAIRTLHRRFLLLAATISIFQDARHGGLLLRFSAAQLDMSHRVGVLGFQDRFVGGHDGIARATKTMFVRMATAEGNRPSRNSQEAIVQGKRSERPRSQDSGVAGTLDRAMLDDFRKKTEHYCSDAAGDENLSGKTLREEGFLAWLRVIACDKAHGVRRVTSRPWFKDALLETIMNTFILGEDAVASLIQYSGELKLWFQRYVEEEAEKVGGCVQSLTLAKHRFDSCQKPLGRCCLHLCAVMAFAISVAKNRSSEKAGRAMVAFLTWVTPFHWVCLAMLADAGDEAIQLIRVFDEEHADKCYAPIGNYFFIKDCVKLACSG